MKYKLTKATDLPKKDKFGIKLDIYPDLDGAGVARISTETGHNQEFYDKESTFTYIVLEGSGTFFLDDEAVKVSKEDMLSITPKTKIYYRGNMELVLITTPAWRPENEVEIKPRVW